jgi:hypothetical protein
MARASWKRLGIALRSVIYVSMTLVFLSSCGLPKIIYLYPPSDFSSSGGNSLTLVHNNSNYDSSEGSSQSFKGYEVYYRAFGNSNDATTAFNKLNSYSVTYGTTDAQSFLSAAQGLGFVRMIAKDNENATLGPPLISIISSSITSTYYFNLYAPSQSLNWTITTSEVIPALNYAVYRNNGRSSSFNIFSDYKSSDSSFDYSGTDAPSTIYFVFFAVAYGLDPSTLGQAVYSAPAIINTVITYSK